MKYLESVKTSLTVILLFISLASAENKVLSPFMTIGLGVNYGDGIEYVPYEKNMNYSIDPTVEAGFFLYEKNRISIEYSLISGSDEVIFSDLSEKCSKFTLNYAFKIFSSLSIGPHGFMKFGTNEYTPYMKIDPTYHGALRDDYKFIGYGVTSNIEPFKHFGIKVYFENNIEIQHARKNTIKDKFDGTSLSFDEGKASYGNFGFYFLYIL